jgi:ribosomal RNA assembly protein
MNSDALKRLERICSCKIGVQEGNSVVIEGDGNAYNEFIAKNIVTALGMGFDMDTALMLKNDDYYFSYIDLRQALGDQKRIIRIKSRIIGEKGKSKKYIESVSSAKMSVYGHTVGFIGKINDVEEAETAVRTLVDGGTHKLAYARMEAHHRKNRQKSRELF